jgi:hypothetical protein
MNRKLKHIHSHSLIFNCTQLNKLSSNYNIKTPRQIIDLEKKETTIEKAIPSFSEFPQRCTNVKTF